MERPFTLFLFCEENLNSILVFKDLTTKALGWTLLISYSLGIGAFWGKGSEWGSLLFMGGVGEEWIGRWEGISVVFLLSVTFLLIQRQTLFWATLLTLLYGFHSLSSYWAGGRYLGELALISSGSKLLLPWLFLSICQGKQLLFDRLARTFVGLVFVSHGLMALALYPKFVDYLIIFWDLLGGGGMQEAGANALLRAIGALDLAVVLWMAWGKRITWPWFWVLIWATATTFMRAMLGGMDNIDEVVIRLPHLLVPLLFLIQAASKPTLP
jgi:hypothetical protein